MKKFRLGLVGRIIIAMVLGSLLGGVLPLKVVRTFVTFNGLFSQLLGFIIPLLILGLVAPAIADIGKKAGKLLLATVALAYTATIISGFASYCTAITTFPALITPSAATEVAAGNEATAYFTIDIEPIMGVMPALVLAFTLRAEVLTFTLVVSGSYSLNSKESVASLMRPRSSSLTLLTDTFRSWSLGPNFLPFK